MEQGSIGLLAGGAGALLMLLIVLLGVVGFAWPTLKSVIRFVGNFSTVNVSRGNGRIHFAGAVDDWRAAPMSPPVPDWNAEQTEEVLRAAGIKDPGKVDT